MVELALQDLVREDDTEARDPIDAECIYQRVEQYASCCFDARTLLEKCAVGDPSIPTVGAWFSEAMLEHMETSWETPPCSGGDPSIPSHTVTQARVAEAAQVVLSGVEGLVKPLAIQLGEQVARAADQTQLKRRLLNACCDGDGDDVTECLRLARDPVRSCCCSVSESAYSQQPH